MSRVLFLFCLSFASVSGVAGVNADQLNSDQSNVLLISIDDLNDWVGCLDGHPQAKTANFDRLATKGTLIEIAHCQSPVCIPSGTRMMTGRTGIYFLSPDLKHSPVRPSGLMGPVIVLQRSVHSSD